MDKLAAIKGTFCDFKLVRTRGQCQLVIEVPIDEADTALAVLGGLPREHDQRLVAIARIALTSEKEVMPNGPGETDAESLPANKTMAPHVGGPDRRMFSDLPMSQQAGIMANDLRFQLWMSSQSGAFANTSPDCASAIRSYCGVASRADISPDNPSGRKWIALLREYERSQGKYV